MLHNFLFFNTSVQNNKFNGKNHVVQKNTFFKNFTRSSSFCRIKVNPKKFRNISFKFKKSDKVCCTPDYTATTTVSAATSQVHGKCNQIIENMMTVFNYTNKKRNTGFHIQLNKSAINLT